MKSPPPPSIRKRSGLKREKREAGEEESEIRKLSKKKTSACRVERKGSRRA